ncbi:hypothetical protein BJV82DRAFT_586183 [Fennellomyces sp. T-0311]|nr:hypothetical protein BJV82DRAFT_586183 [Fennellomyces sp. T-0311]
MFVEHTHDPVLRRKRRAATILVTQGRKGSLHAWAVSWQQSPLKRGQAARRVGNGCSATGWFCGARSWAIVFTRCDWGVHVRRSPI